MGSLIQRIEDFFKGEGVASLWDRIYEWFENTLRTLFYRIPYEPIRDLFTNPWFWLIVVFLVILLLLLRRR
jgi:uncharacterized membrane protein